MIAKIKMTDEISGNSVIMYRCPTKGEAINIAAELNRLNQEAARLTGQAIRFVYSVIISR